MIVHRHVFKYLVLSAVGLYLGAMLLWNKASLQQAASQFVFWSTDPTWQLYEFLVIIIGGASFLVWFAETGIRRDERRKTNARWESKR